MQLEEQLARERRNLTLWRAPGATLYHFGVYTTTNVSHFAVVAASHPATLFVALPLLVLYGSLKYAGAVDHSHCHRVQRAACNTSVIWEVCSEARIHGGVHYRRTVVGSTKRFMRLPSPVPEESRIWVLRRNCSRWRWGGGENRQVCGVVAGPRRLVLGWPGHGNAFWHIVFVSTGGQGASPHPNRAFV